METHEVWGLPPATKTFRTKPTSLSTSISQYFRKPAKITKSSSRTNSPRNSNRRRTSSHVPTRTQSVVDRPRTNIIQYQDMSNPQSRPLSWHPPSTQAGPLESVSYGTWMSSDFNFASPTTYYNTAEVNGLVTPISYAAMDEPQIQELITPLDELTAYDAANHNSLPSYQNFNPYWISDTSSDYVQNLLVDEMQTRNDCSDFSFNTNSHYIESSTAPPTPNFLPIQTMEGDLNLSPLDASRSIEEQDDLVGLGLYDSPAEVQSVSRPFENGLGISGLASRKSLKLEDSFEPTSDEVDPEPEDGHVAFEQTDSSATSLQLQEMGYADASMMSNLMNHSFYFENDNDNFSLSYVQPAHGAYGANTNIPSYTDCGWI